MAVGFPTKANWAAGDVLTASAQDDLAGTVNLLSNASAATGSQLVSNVAGTSFAYQATPSASNPVLNAAAAIWQRGTSIAVTTNTTVYTADRWLAQPAGLNMATTVSRQATGDTTNLPNIQYALRYQRNSGQTGTSPNYLSQAFESVNSIPFAGKVVTFSFYARAGANYSATTSYLLAQLQAGTSTDAQYVTGTTNVVNSNATLTTTWQRFTYTSSTIPTNTTQIGVVFTSTPTGTAGTNDYFEITGVQIDIGSVALPFRTYASTYQNELAACQRYYFRSVPTYSYSRMPAVGFGSTATQVNFLVNYPVTMRTNPSSIDFSTLAAYDQVTITSLTNLVITSSSSTTQSADLTGTVTAGIVAYRPYELIANNNTSAYFGLSAEL